MRREDYFKEDWLAETGVWEERLHRRFDELNIKPPHDFQWIYHRTKERQERLEKNKMFR